LPAIAVRPPTPSAAPVLGHVPLAQMAGQVAREAQLCNAGEPGAVRVSGEARPGGGQAGMATVGDVACPSLGRLRHRDAGSGQRFGGAAARTGCGSRRA